MFLVTETCKSKLKINWFTYIFEIGQILLQSELTGPDATFYTTTNIGGIPWTSETHFRKAKGGATSKTYGPKT